MRPSAPSLRPGRVASSAELHRFRELARWLQTAYEVSKGPQWSSEDAQNACTPCLTHLLRRSLMSVLMRSIDPEAARGQSERSGVVSMHNKQDPDTYFMR